MPAPDSVLDTNGRPRFGSYRGQLPPVNIEPLGLGRLFRLAHHKRWMYTVIASSEALIALAVIDLGYLTDAFVFVLDARDGRMVADHSSIGPFFAASVSDSTAEGGKASFKLGRTHVRVERRRGETAYRVDARIKDIEVRAALESASAPPAIAAIAPIPLGLVDMTEKRSLLRVSGEAVAAGRRYSLDGALAGYDYTNGLLARRTVWQWAFALGRAKSGERVGLNVVEGFVGERECAVWVEGEVFPLAEGRFTYDRQRPLDPWRVRTADGGVDLRFRPGGMHSEHKNFGFLASRFVQPAGVFSGSIRVDGRGELELENVLGVTEDQDMLW